MSTIDSLAELRERFNDFEENQLLFDNEFSYIWEILRFRVYRTLTEQYFSAGEAHDDVPHNTERLSKRYSTYLRIIKDSIVSYIKYVSYFWTHKHPKFLFIGSKRRRLEEDGLYWDIYIDPLLECLNSDDYVVFEEYHLHKHLVPTRTSNLLYLDFLLPIKALKEKIGRKTSWNNALMSFYQKIQTQFEIEFKCSLNLISLAKQASIIFPIKKEQYTRLLKKSKPSIVFIVCSYGKEALIQAAKDMAIPVVELQHGVWSKYHLGYDFPSKKKTLFPDYMFSFGEYWTQKVRLSIPPSSCYAVGYPYLIQNLVKLDQVHLRKRNQILFLSQGTIGKELAEFAIELKKIIPTDIEILYKLHPGELIRWKNGEYPELLASFEKGEIAVIDSDKPSLYQLLAQSKWQIGVNSTALYEGIVLGCNTYVVNLFGVEYSEDLIERGLFKLVEYPGDIDFIFNDISRNVRDEFFASDWKSNFLNAIDDLEKNLKLMVTPILPSLGNAT